MLNQEGVLLSLLLCIFVMYFFFQTVFNCLVIIVHNGFSQEETFRKLSSRNKCSSEIP